MIGYEVVRKDYNQDHYTQGSKIASATKYSQMLAFADLKKNLSIHLSRWKILFLYLL